MVNDSNMGDETTGGTTPTTTEKHGTDMQVDPQRAALVKEWLKRVKEAETHWEAKAFKRMRVCMKLAADGTTDKADAEGEGEGTNYVVPIINRLVNQATASLYAKNPTAVAKRKKKLQFKLWDGDPKTLEAAVAAVQQAQATPAPVTDPMTGAPAVDPASGQPTAQPSQPDPNAVAMLMEVEQVRQNNILYDRMSKTMELLFAYFLEEQDAGYKEQFKAMVRRTKTNSVAYVELDFQRLLEQNPDVAAQIADVTSKISSIEATLAEVKNGDVQNEDPDLETLRLNLQDLSNQLEVIVREGPVLSFPRSTEVFPDKKCRDLRTWAGSRFIARRYDMEPGDILETYKVDVASSYTPYKDNVAVSKDAKEGCCRVYRVQDKKNQQVFVVCDGYPDFIVEPATPDVNIERFWTIFALVFNGTESEDNPYPNSDVWNARHMQREYNSSAQGRREHKIAARPRWAAPTGKLEQKDKDALKNSVPFEVIELNSLMPGEDVKNLLQAVPVSGVDPNLYETSSAFTDLQRAVGMQEANLGGTSGDTATESSIAENSRTVAQASDVDDLDTMLTALSRALGQVLLLNMSKETVIEIAGPGAVWPDAPPTREQVVKDLLLEVEAGSSGRPNKAAEVANLERSMPWVLQIPGMNPMPWAKKFLALEEIDLEEGYVDGLPSIAAANRMIGANPQAGGGPNDPNAQGDKGGDNAPSEQHNEPQSQPEYTQPGPGTSSV